MIETLFSKASHSNELVARINHNNLILDPYSIKLFPYHLRNQGPQTLIQAVGDYLMRVVGSVPLRFHLTAGSRRGERELYYYDTDVVRF